MKQENNKHKRNSNRSMAFNHKASSSFYNNRTNIFNPFISSAKTDINNNNLSQNKSNSNISTSKMRKSQKKKKSSKSSNKLSISKKSVKSLQSNDNYYNQATSSFKVLNSIRNSNKNNFINSKGKEKIHDKYNTYFNCFVSDLYEKQKEKLINEKKIKIKKAKSTIKIKKLEDYIGPNLYNEQVDAPDFGYICYKANKKINPNYSLNNPMKMKKIILKMILYIMKNLIIIMYIMYIEIKTLFFKISKIIQKQNIKKKH